MSREFPVVSPDPRAVFAVVGAAALLTLIGIGVMLSVQPRVDGRLAAAMALAMAVALAPIVLSLRRRGVRLDGDTLHVAAGLHSAKTKIAQIDLAQAMVADLNRARELRPFWQTFGTRIPGYYAGHFILRDRRRAFALLTARDRVLVLPLRDGRLWLLSLERPQALLDALHKAAASAPAAR